VANEIRRDILLALRSESNLSAIDAAIAKVAALERRVAEANGRLKLTVQVTGTENLGGALNNAASGIQKATKAARDAKADFTNFGKLLTDREKELGIVADRVKEVQRVLKSGEVRTTKTLAGPGLTASFTKETGVSSVAVDFRKTPAAVQARQEAELLKLYGQQRVKDAREAARQEADLNKQYGQQRVRENRLIQNQQADYFRDYGKRRVAEFKQQQREETEAFDSALREKQKRERFSQNFNSIRQRPGVREAFGPERFTQSGELVRDRLLVDEAGKIVAKLNAETGRATASTRLLNQETKNTGDTFQNAAGKVLLWTLATSAVLGTFNAIRAGGRAFIEAEQAQIRLERVGRGFGKGQEVIAQGAQTVSSEILRMKVAFGQTGDEAQEAAVIFARLGLSQTETLEAVRVSLLASNVAGIGAADAARLLASAMAQFQLSARELPDLLNKLNTLENNNRITTDDLLQSISRTGGVFREAGGSFEQLAAITAVVGQSTGRTGAEIGNALKTIVTRLGEAKNQAKVFEQSGVGIRNVVGQFKPLDQILSDLVVKFQSLSDAQKADITTTIAGARQRNILQAALDNYFNIQGQVIQQLNSAKSAEEENARVLSTLAAKITSLKAAFEQLAVSIGQSGLGDLLKTLIGFLTNMVRGFAELGTVGGLALTAIGATISGLILKSVLAASLEFLSLSRSIQTASNAQLQFVATSSAQQAASLRGVAANQALAASYQRLAQASTAASAAAGTATAGLATRALALLGPIGTAIAVATAAISAIALIRGSTSPQSRQEQAREQNARSEERIKTSENRVESFKQNIRFAENAAKALKAIEDAELSGAGVTKTAGKTREQIYSNIIKLHGLTGDEISKASRKELKAADVTIIAERLKQQAIRETQKLRDEVQQQIDSSGRRQVQAAGELEALRGEKRRIEAELSSARRNPTARGRERGARDSLAAINKEIEKKAKELEDLRAATDKLIERRDGPKEEPKFEQDFTDIDQLKEDLDFIEKKTKLRFIIETDLAERSIDRIDTELKQTKALIDAFETRAAAIPDEAVEQRKEAKEQIDKLRDKEAELTERRNAEQLKEGIKKAADEFKNRFQRGLNLRDKIAEFLAGDGPEDTRDIDRAEARINAEKQTIAELENRLKASREQKPSADVAAEAQRRISEHELENQLIAAKERLNDRVNDKTEAQLETMRKIRQEQQKQAEETRKELSGLSDIELIRVRIFAQRVKEGQVEKPNQAEFLNFNQETRKFITKFDELFPGKAIAPNLDLGFGPEAFSRNVNLTQDRLPLSQQEQNIRRSLVGAIGADPENIGGAAQRSLENLRLNARQVILQGPQEIPVPPAAKGVSAPPPGALNIDLNLNGLEVPADKIVNLIGLEVRRVAQEIVDGAVQRGEKAIAAGFSAPVRSRA